MTDPEVRKLRAGPPPTPQEAERARERDLLVSNELPRIRTLATAWRNALAAMLAAIVGFGLIKGRGDISLLAPAYARLAGILLALTLVVGVAAVFRFLRAAHGRITMIRLESLQVGPAGDHREAISSVRALKQGIGLALALGLLLIAAVGVTWYGPGKGLVLRVNQGGSSDCGVPQTLSNGNLVLMVSGRDVAIDFARVTAIVPADTC